MSEVKYTTTHEWLQQNGDEVTVGITKHAQELLGDMVFIEMPAIGASVIVGAEIGVVESVKAASDFYAPISGVITAINENALTNPAIVNQDPYGLGWLVKMKPTNVLEIDNLLTEAQYDSEIAKGH